ncbi:MAG: hypothetical protein GY786_12610 [Proteobacteria bacterium]|nr:hypothetical protein [Pseudomonadota bacterium]
MHFFNNVHDVIRNGKPYSIPPEEAQMTTSVIEAAIKSNETGELVKMGES